MRKSMLTHEQSQLLRDEKETLTNMMLRLSELGVPSETLAMLQKAILQLDELFLLVVVGEFNAGKSALVNALLGERVLPEGVTPTTAKVTLVKWGEQVSEYSVDEGYAIYTYPLPLLQEVNIVDSPGTNAIIRIHERLTEEFVPRSDLVLFVTSADRPLTESERQFLERILHWGKKVIFIVNKSDIFENDEAMQEVKTFVEENTAKTLGTKPEVFVVSARLAQRAARETEIESKRAFRMASNLDSLENYIVNVLDDQTRLNLKMKNPLGVAGNLLEQLERNLQNQQNDLSQDNRTIQSINTTIDSYSKDLDMELKPRLAEVENLLHDFEQRGLDFYDNTLKLSNIRQLLKPESVKKDFEQNVLHDVPQKIEAQVQQLIDWLVTKDLNAWQQVMNALQQRQALNVDQVVGDGVNLQVKSRRDLLDKVGKDVKRVIETYDRTHEARELADTVEQAVAQTALFEVGAVGLGVLVTTVLASSALDITGIVAASTLAVVGLLVIPYKKKQSKDAFREKMTKLRADLRKALESSFEHESEHAIQRLQENVAPYTSYVSTEQERIQSQQTVLEQVKASLDDIRARIVD